MVGKLVLTLRILFSSFAFLMSLQWKGLALWAKLTSWFVYSLTRTARIRRELRRRINTEENTKVVAAVWGTVIPCCANYFALAQYEE